MSDSNVRVIFLGDALGATKAAKDVESSIGRVGVSAGKSGKQIEGLGTSAEKSQKKLVTMGSVGGLAMGAAGLALGIRQAVDAFTDLDAKNVRVAASLSRLGINTKGVRDQIDSVISSQMKLSGFQEGALKGSFGTLLTATGNVTQALKDNALAMDFARGRQIDVGTSANVLAKVIGGNVAILNRYSVGVAKGTSVTQALALVQQKFGGQAKAFGDSTAGQAARIQSQFELLEANFGGKLVPVLNEGSGALLGVANAADHLASHVGGMGAVIAGAGGFGAFQLAVPIASRFSTLVSKIGADAADGGGGVKGLAGAIAGSISPMGLAAGGAAILAGGIYEIWHNSESASQAMKGFDKTVQGVQAALSQRTVAKNAVNDAKDQVKATESAVQAARDHAEALHGVLVQAQATGASQSDLTKLTKAWQSAMQAVVPLVHQHADATATLDQAQINLKISTQGVTDSIAAQSRKAGDMISKAKDAATALNGGAASAHKWTGGIGESTTALAEFIKQQAAGAQATKNTDTNVSNLHEALSLFAGDLGRLPTIKQIKIASTYAAHGDSVDVILDKLESIKSKVVTITTDEVKHPFTQTPNPINPTGPPIKSAAGNMIDRPMLSMVGEDAPRWPEWIIPSNPQHRGRALGLLSQATTALGIPGFAAGGGPSRGGMAIPPGKPLRQRGPVNLKGVLGAAASSIGALKAVQQQITDAGRSYDQTDRSYSATSFPFTLDVPDDPTDPTGSTHQVLNAAGISARVAQLGDLENRKQGIVDLLGAEAQAINDAIAKVQKAIDDLLAAIKRLEDKAKAEAEKARTERASAANDRASVSKKGGLQDQLSAEQAKKKPSASVIAGLKKQIDAAGTSAKQHDSLAKAADTAQGRLSDQAKAKAGTVNNLRGTLSDLGSQRHDQPYDVRDQQIDLQYLAAEIATDQGTSVSPFSSTANSIASAVAGASDDTSALLAQIAQLTNALGLQGAQANVLGGFPSFAKGAIHIPNDMVAQLHAGESVRTADQTSSDMRNGGSPVHVHVELSGPLEPLGQFVDARVTANVPGITSSIGRSADRLKRSGRIHAS